MKVFTTAIFLALALGLQAAPTDNSAQLDKKEYTFDTSHLFQKRACYTTDCDTCIREWNMLKCSMAPYPGGGCGGGLAEARASCAEGGCC
ncbi:hypothetical protein NW762_012475 [Fusarium torreyae]|uniref:Uncharacterized protein n=1 Tax=Fusarium torreyae TaxID=1237075 RepID=A0A9W8RP21_9HYPO|nr:hypothetical protein NW762_012475 [Fusarium torreyae]